MKLLLILWTLFKESQFANYGMPSNSLSSLHHKKTIPALGIVESVDKRIFNKI